MHFLDPIFGVHLPDGLIQGPGIIAGWCVAFLLLLVGSRNLSNDEIPKISLLTAVFFLTSLFPIPVPGGPKTHLLLNGLIGVILGQRAILAIAPALFLQSLLFAHGGFLSLGLNICVMTIPALFIRSFAKIIQKPLILGNPVTQLTICFCIIITSIFAVTAGILMLAWQFKYDEKSEIINQVFLFLVSPASIFGFTIASMVISWILLRSRNGMLFALGFFIGLLGVLLTIVLHTTTMLFCSVPNLEPIIFITCMIHLPLAIAEGLSMGLMISFLAKVKPDLLSSIGYGQKEQGPIVETEP
jgi:cobalt/nickel transport system permease protein